MLLHSLHFPQIAAATPALVTVCACTVVTDTTALTKSPLITDITKVRKTKPTQELAPTLTHGLLCLHSMVSSARQIPRGSVRPSQPVTTMDIWRTMLCARMRLHRPVQKNAGEGGIVGRASNTPVVSQEQQLLQMSQTVHIDGAHDESQTSQPQPHSQSQKSPSVRPTPRSTGMRGRPSRQNTSTNAVRKRRAMKTAWRTYGSRCDELFTESAFIDNIIDMRKGNYVRAVVSRLKIEASSRQLPEGRIRLAVLRSASAIYYMGRRSHG